ncbi:MAG: fibrobacter succinogenes major paralogous domain-containing protein [Dysgonamonadaceae bacterium]|jgi:uncharacterized protein (TIGR02145 family)|nr:fibrobacter succinogenes major paralogous domain-containing protein [Dysgonamonadaceae bacterium]
MKQKMMFLALMLFVLSTASANAQVRIGGTTDPHSAATLDLNANDDDAPTSNSGGFYLPRISLTSTTQQLNGTDPLNGAMIWNTNKDFYLGKGVYVWGDNVWVPIQRTLVNNSTLQPVTTDPFVTILSNPALGLGVTFYVPSTYGDMSNTARFSWEVKVKDENGTSVTTDYDPVVSTSGSRQEVLFVPYDATERTYEVRVKAMSNNGTSDSDWSEEVLSSPGKYQGWYRINGATGYDINATAYNDPANGRDADRVRLSLTGNYYTVETLGGTDTPTYSWTIQPNPGDLAFLEDNLTNNATVELKFRNSILTDNDLVNNPAVAKTFILQCVVSDDISSYTLQKTITVGDRDECSPVAGLRDAEGNDYTVSKFDGVCWMTQNLRSTYTWQGNLRQEISVNAEMKNDNTAVSYYYPGGSPTIFGGHLEYGLLYTWGAANIGTATTESVNAFPFKTSDRQGICPDGWTIPSDYDWNRLEKEIATNPSLYSAQTEPFEWDDLYDYFNGWRPAGGNAEGTWWSRSMKSPTSVGTTTNTYGVSKTDGTGFNALLVGTLVTGSAEGYCTYANFWSSSVDNSTVVWRRYMSVGNSGALRNTINKYYMSSVGCKK